MDRHMAKAKHKETGKWFVGFPMKIQGKHMLLLDDEQNLLRVHYIEDKMWDAETYAVEIDETTICRPTGLTDKNGNKIWENDVFKHYNRVSFEDYESHTIGLVEWDEIHCRYTNKKWKNNEIYLLNSECVYEVIGNKFDNPELLEVLS